MEIIIKVCTPRIRIDVLSLYYRRNIGNSRVLNASTSVIAYSGPDLLHRSILLANGHLDGDSFVQWTLVNLYYCAQSFY